MLHTNKKPPPSSESASTAPSHQPAPAPVLSPAARVCSARRYVAWNWHPGWYSSASSLPNSWRCATPCGCHSLIRGWNCIPQASPNLSYHQRPGSNFATAARTASALSERVPSSRSRRPPGQEGTRYKRGWSRRLEDVFCRQC